MGDLLFNDRTVTQPLRILAFEENRLNQMLVKRQLTHPKFQAMVTGSYEEGLAHFRAHGSDLLLVDITMPMANGVGMLQDFRERGHGAHRIPAIAISASDTLAEAYRSYGFVDFIQRPYDKSELFAKIYHWGRNSGANGSFHHLGPLIRESNADVAFLEEFVQLFKINVVQYLGHAKVCLQKADYKGFRMATHRVKGSLLAIGADLLVHRAHVLLDASLQQKGAVQIHGLLEDFSLEYKKLERDLGIELGTFKAMMEHYDGKEKNFIG
ncbi:MAG: response regulator [Flavobacteriaceae bacterium]